MTEEPLLGGTTSGVLRVGHTVRRPGRPWTATVEALLAHLETAGFPAPRSRGLDDDGRQILTWIPGETTWERHADHWGTSEQLRRAARLVRLLHEVLDEFVPPADATWRGGWGRGTTGRGPVCHCDLAPYNVVAGANGALSIIDFDGAGPHDRMRELAYATESFALLRRDATCTTIGWTSPPPRAERVEVFWQAFGLPRTERSTLADALVDNARDRARFGERMYAEGREPFASWWAVDRGAGDREDLVVTEAVALEWRGRYDG